MIINNDFAGEASGKLLSSKGLLILGGQSTEGRLASIETLGFKKCKIPPLPETRYNFAAFITPTKPPQLAVCGGWWNGWWKGKPVSSDCLTLDVANAQWVRGKFTNGIPVDGVDGVRRVIDVKKEGIYVIHSRGISFLKKKSQKWIKAAHYRKEAVCGCILSDKSFVTIHLSDQNNVQEYSVRAGGKLEKEPQETWPDLVRKRQGPGCGATSQHLVVAGGMSGWEVLTSVEVFNIAAKSLGRGGSLQQARAFFQLIRVGSTHPYLLALGGEGPSLSIDTSESWDEEENSWNMGPTLSTGRSYFGAIMAPHDLACSDIEPPPHSCPAADDSGQTCTFSSVESGKSMTKTTNLNIFIIFIRRRWFCL